MEISPEADQLQVTFLTVFFLGCVADGLKGPYLYALYNSYNISHQTIEFLFVIASISSLCIGTFVASLADTLGRRRACLLCAFLFSLAYGAQNFRQLPILFLGRICSGIAVSLYHTSFESWLIQEHRLRDLDQPSLAYILRNAHVGNAILAVFAGILSQFIVLKFGYVAAFNTGIVVYIIMMILIYQTWSENYGNIAEHKNSSKIFLHALKSIRKKFLDLRITLLGLCSALFEATILIFTIEWTPILQSASKHFLTKSKTLPYGIIFACFMLLVMIGAYLSGLIIQRLKSSLEYLLIGIFHLAIISLVISIVYSSSQWTTFVSFLSFEFCVGFYHPIIGVLRSTYIPDEIRSTLMSYFRVPQNIITLAVLLAPLQLSTILFYCIVFIILALICLSIIVNLSSLKTIEIDANTLVSMSDGEII